MQKYLQRLHAEGKRVALFGAGHLAAKFINFYGLTPFLNSVVDDNPHKRKCLMPGSQLPITGSQCLEAGEVDLCLLTLNPESEQKVLKAKQTMLPVEGGSARFSPPVPAVSTRISDVIPVEKVGDGVFVSRQPIVCIGDEELDFIKREAS